jgi:rRNA maturation endonuclease Nob1
MGRRLSGCGLLGPATGDLTMSTLSRVKTVFMSGEDAKSHPYECKSCGARFRLRQQVCPECGGYTLDRIEWSS